MVSRVFGASLAVYALGVIAAVVSLGRYKDAYTWVEHTSDVRMSIGRAIDHAEEVRDCPALRRDLATFSELTRDNPIQQARLPSLMMTVAMHCAGRDGDLIDRLANLDATERDLLLRRRVELATVRQRALLAFIGALVLATLMTAFARWMQSRATRDLVESEERFRQLAMYASDLQRIHDASGRAIWVSPSVTQLLGYTPEEILEMPPLIQLGHPDDLPAMKAELERIQKPNEPAGLLKYQLRTKSGLYRWFETYSVPVRDRSGRLLRFFTSGRDVTDRIVAQSAAEEAALTDELTGLLNRRGFTTVASTRHALALRQKKGMAILFADLDGLKKINDEQGHDLGDRAIKELAEVLRSTFRDSDVVARLGGDEFAILAYDVDEQRIEIVMQRVRAAIARKNEGERPFTLACSLGYALFSPDRPQSLDELIAQADKKMYEHKVARRAQRA